MAAKTERITVRVAPDVKEASDALFTKIGLNTSDAINMFLHQCLRVDGIPFNLEGVSRKPR